MVEKKNPKILIYGYGNPGRQDDGLGVALADSIEKWAIKENITTVFTDSNYQLNVEDATVIADKDIVIFADASIEENVSDFLLTEVKPTDVPDFLMHSVSPGFVLDLCNKMFQYTPHTYLLHIKGYEWDMKEELTEKATQNLNKACIFIKSIIQNPYLEIKKSIQSN